MSNQKSNQEKISNIEKSRQLANKKSILLKEQQ